jgi:hypothetical protein
MRKKLICTTLLISIVVSLMIFSVAQSTPDNMIYVDPPLVWDPEMSIGTEFTVDIKVDYVVRLLIYQFHLKVDPAVLRPVSWEDGDFLTSTGCTPIFYPGEGFEDDPEDPNYGWLYLVVSALDPDTPVPLLPIGGGVLARVTFMKVGDGSSLIELGQDCGLIDRTGKFISKGNVEHGYFSNEVGPELYIRQGGSGGGPGAWPEWSAGTLGEEQILYSHVTNKGPMGATVKVKYTVESKFTMEEYWTDEYPVGVGDPDETRITVSTGSFIPGEGVHTGYYYVYAELYFKAGGMTTFVSYTTVEDALGGTGETKSQGIPVKFKVS